MIEGLVSWLVANEPLAGWAQFFGAMLALGLTYFSAFAPTWRRRRQLRDEATRLLMHGYEVVESFHRTSANFAPYPLSLRQASLTMYATAEEIGKFPVYELDRNFGPLSLARRLLVMRMLLGATRLFLDAMTDQLDGNTATPEEHENIRSYVAEQVLMAEKLVLEAPMERPTWPPQTEPAA